MSDADLQTLLSEAEHHYNAGRREEARAIYSDILGRDPKHPIALHAMGWLAHEAGDDAGAEPLIERALAIDPKSPGFHNSLGVIRLARGNAEGAQEAFGRLTELLPDDPRGYLNLGHARRRLGRWADAAAAYVEATRRAPDWVDAHLAAGVAFREAGDFHGAATAFANAVRIRPDIAMAHHELAMSLLRTGRIDDAIAAFRNAVTFDPSFSQAYCNLGLALEDRGDRAGALSALREAHRLAPDSAFISYHLAAIAAAVGQPSAAPPACPPEYLLELFDNYAERFDEHLVKNLNYVGPALLFEAVNKALGLDAESGRSLDILDLGCGTGLTGVPFEPFARSIAGVDLSQRMLDLAAQRKNAQGKPLYTRLVRADVLIALREEQEYDLILAADVFIYIGDLREIFAAAVKAVRPGGLFAFTIEWLYDNRDDYRVLTSRRYAQSAAYIERLTKENGFSEVFRRTAALRQGDDGIAVEGLVFLLRRGPESAS